MREVPLGWVGFDGGLKRAISFARGPQEEPDDEEPRRPIRRACLPEDTLLDLTLTGITLCGCVAGSPRWNIVSDPNDILGVWQDIPLQSSTTFTTAMVQFYSDECVTPDGDPVGVNVGAFISCADGYYTIQVFLETVSFGPFLIFETDGNYMLDETQGNQIACVGSATFNLPFTIDNAEVSLAA